MSDKEKATLEELVDLNELQSIQDSFAKCVGISSVIFSPGGEPLTRFSNTTRLCSFIQSTSEGKRRCFQSCKEMSKKALELKEPNISYCFVHSGHFVAPIIINGDYKGAMFAGQFIPQKFSPEQLKELEKIAVEINLDPLLLVEEAKMMRVVEEDVVWSYSSLLFQVVRVIARLGMQAAELNRAKDALQKAHDELESCVLERTAKWAESNEQLKQEITERKQKEEELKKAAIILDAMIDGVTITDMQGKVIGINKATTEQLGYTKEEVIGKTPGGLFATESDSSKFFKTMEKLLSGKSIEHSEFIGKRKNGTEFPASVNLSVINDSKGNPKEVVAVHRDITERKKTEEKLRLFLQAVKSSIDGMAMGDLEGRITYANEAFLRMFGYSEEELIGQEIAFIYAEDQIPKLEEALKETMEGGWVGELVGKRKDGELFPIAISSSIVVDDEGKVIAQMANHRDISELKRAEVALHEIRERLAVTLKSIGDGVITTDTGGGVTLMNDVAQELTGWKIEEAIGQPSHEIFRIINEKTQNPVEDPIARVLREGKIVGLGNHSVLIARDGTKRAIADSGAPIKASGGAIIGVVLVFRDVTEKRKAEEEREVLFKKLEETNRKLKRSNRELQDFVYIASHDLREPMRKISAFGLLLQESLRGRLDADEEENLEFMIDGATRMQQMIDDLLNYSRITTKAKPFERVDLNEIIANLKRIELAVLLEEIGGVIEVPKPLPHVHADPSQMHQLLQNLIGNGLKYHREDVPPVITVSGQVENGNRAHIEVQDNGIGISEEYYEKIFGMFQRLHPREKYEGTGIGLAVCKKIVERHGGEIGVESILGEGSTFWFTLARDESGELDKRW